jgi:hypothetical protein
MPARKDPATPVRARAFLKAYRELGRVDLAAKASGNSRRSHYYWMRFKKYRIAFNRSRREAGGIYEDELLRRAMEGHLEPVFYQGRPITDEKGRSVGIRRYPDHLLLEACKAFLPERWKQRVEHTGKNGGPISVQNFNLEDLSDAELDSLVALLKKAGSGVEATDAELETDFD